MKEKPRRDGSIEEQRQVQLRQQAIGKSSQEAGRVLIRVVELHKSFGENHVLRGIHLEIEEGKTTVIIGSSGCGKSVFVKHLIGLLKPDSGEIWVDGEEITRMTKSELNRVRKKFGMCFQMAALFDSMTVEENVSFPLLEHARLPASQVKEQVREVLGQVGLKGVEERLPAELSGGMRKRVGLARAVILKPSIVIYDEPTTGLDPLLTEDVDDMILDAQRDFHVTSVVISHDVGSVFRIADRIAMIEQGSIAAYGTPQQIMDSTNPAVQKFIHTFG